MLGDFKSLFRLFHLIKIKVLILVTISLLSMVHAPKIYSQESCPPSSALEEVESLLREQTAPTFVFNDPLPFEMQNVWINNTGYSTYKNNFKAFFELNDSTNQNRISTFALGPGQGSHGVFVVEINSKGPIIVTHGKQRRKVQLSTGEYQTQIWQPKGQEQLSFDKYLNDAEKNEDLEGSELYTFNSYIKETALFRDDRGVYFATSQYEDCTQLPKRKRSKREASWLESDPDGKEYAKGDGDRLFDDQNFVMRRCLTDSGNPGVCCDTKCIEAEPLDDSSCGSSHGPAKDECGRVNQNITKAYNGTSCSGTKKKKHMMSMSEYYGSKQEFEGHCLDGKCYECVNTSDVCKEAVGTKSEDDSTCIFKFTQDGSLCGDKKVCENGVCIDYKKSSAGRSSIAINKECTYDDGRHMHNGNPCGGNPSNPSQANNKYCLDGSCHFCDKNSRDKLIGALPCLPHPLTGKIGTRVSCQEPDICDYN